MKYLFICFSLIAFLNIKAQIGIGTNNPDAGLDILSPIKIDINDFSDFEDGTLGSWNNVYPSLFTVQTTEVFNGSQALSSGAVMNDERSGINFNINLPSGRDYVLELYAKFDLAPNASFFAGGNAYTSVDNGDWQKITIPLNSGNNSINMILDLDNGATGDAGKVYLDDIKIGAIQYALKVVDGNQGDGMVLTSDDYGNATWATPKLSKLTDNDEDTRVETTDANLIRMYTSNFPILSISQTEIDLNASKINLTIDASATGFHAIAGGDGAQASGNNTAAWNSGEAVGSSSTAWGNSIANGILSSAWGSGAIANEYGATAWGNNTSANGYQSTSWGNNNTANKDYGTVWGGFNSALGQYTTMWGYNNYSLADSTTTWGADNENNGLLGTVWGQGNRNTGSNSTILGFRNVNGGVNSYVWNHQNNNEGDMATIWGLANINNTYLNTIFGHYSVNRLGSPATIKESEPLLQIGNGNEEERNDALIILKNGNVGINFAFDGSIPKEKLEVHGNILSHENISGDKLFASQNIGIGKFNPIEEFEIYNNSDTSHMKLTSLTHNSIIDLQGPTGAKVRMLENGISQAEMIWTGSEMQLFSSPPTTFPIIRFPTIRMTQSNKVGIKKGLLNITEALDVGGRVKIGYSDETPSSGVLRFNSTSGRFQGYNGTNWLNFGELPVDEDGDSSISFIENSTQDSIVFTVNGDETMSFNGHKLSIGKNGNTFIGYNTAASDFNNNIGNTSLGWQSTPFFINGVSNTNLGFWTGYLAQTGDWNTNLGAYAGYSNQYGSKNTMVGYYAGYNNEGSGNVFLGHMAGRYATGDNKLYIDNSDTIAPLIYGNFDFNTLTINGSLTVSNLKSSEFRKNLIVDNKGKILAEENPSSWTFYSGDFHDWYNNINNVECAVGLNNILNDGDTIQTLSATVIPFNPLTHQGMEISIMIRNLSNGSYFTIVDVADNNIPSSATTYTDSTAAPVIVDKTNFEYLLVSAKTSSQILKVTIGN